MYQQKWLWRIICLATIVASTGFALQFDAAPSLAQTTPPARNLVLVNILSADTASGVMIGDLLYDGEGPRLTVSDFSDPTRPVRLGMSTPVFREGLVSLAVDGSRAFALDGRLGLHTFDIADPARPTRRGYLDLKALDPEAVLLYPGEGPSKVVLAAAGPLVLIAAGSLNIVDVTDLDRPTMRGRARPEFSHEPYRAVASNGHQAYVTDCEGAIRVFDLAEPARPREVGFYETHHDHTFPHLSCSNQIVVHDALVYVPSGGMPVIDVSDPSNPTEVAYYLRGATRVSGVRVLDGQLFIADEDRVVRLDSRDPTNLQEVSSYRGRLLTGNRRHLRIDQDSDVHTLTLDSTPRLVSARPNPGRIRWIGAVGDRAIVHSTAISEGTTYARVLDVTDPETPAWSPVATRLLGGEGLSLFGSYAIGWAAPDRAARPVSSLYALRDDRLDHVELTLLPGLGPSAGGRYTSSDGPWGLRIFDVGDDGRVVWLGAPGLPPRPTRQRGSLAYVAGDDGLQIYDIADLTRMARLSTLPLTGSTQAIAVDGQLAVLVGDYGLYTVDVTDARRPVLRGAYRGLRFTDVAVVGGMAYAVGPGGLRVLDIGSGLAPRETASYPLDGDPRSVAVINRHVLVANGSLWVLRITN